MAPPKATTKSIARILKCRSTAVERQLKVFYNQMGLLDNEEFMKLQRRNNRIAWLEYQNKESFKRTLLGSAELAGQGDVQDVQVLFQTQRFEKNNHNSALKQEKLAEKLAEKKRNPSLYRSMLPIMDISRKP